VLRLTLNADETGIAAVQTLASGPDLLEDVSLGAVRRRSLPLRGAQRLAAYDDKGRPNGAPHQRPVIATLTLPPG